MEPTIENLPVEVRQFLDVVELEADGVVEVTILNDVQYSDAATSLRHIKTQIAKLGEERLNITRPIDETKKRITALFQPYLDKLNKAANVLSSAILEYNAEVERKRAAAQAEANRAAKQKAEEERAKLTEDAEKALDQGKPELAVIYAEKAEAVVERPIDAVKMTRPAGTGIVTRWEYEITDVNLVPREFLMVDKVALGRVVTAMKDKTNIPGVRAFPSQSVSSRRI